MNRLWYGHFTSGHMHQIFGLEGIHFYDGNHSIHFANWLQLE